VMRTENRVVLASPELRMAPLGSDNLDLNADLRTRQYTLNQEKSGLDFGVHYNTVEFMLKKIGEKLVKSPVHIALVRPELRVLILGSIKEVLIRDEKCLVAGGKTIPAFGKTLKIVICKERICVNGTPEGRELLVLPSNHLSLYNGGKWKKYRGEIVVSQTKGNLRAINMVDIEGYLKGVIPAEVYASWPVSALKAQAVATRSYAMYQFLHRRKLAYGLVDNAGYQMYKGIGAETDRTNIAVDETKGEILVYRDKPILAMYTANSGGYTADPSYIFGGSKRPYLLAKLDQFSLEGKMARWKRIYRRHEIENRPKQAGFKINGLQKILPETITPSGRIVRVKLTDTHGEHILRTRTTLRRVLDLAEILLKIDQKNSSIVF
ncbi:MAG: SpoIID/LytB domain-containing protein, partial [Thermoplasmata archaeon]|nr:SpoIID/LytB domain-containing protein [Thermoplasmata archaeon]